MPLDRAAVTFGLHPTVRRHSAVPPNAPSDAAASIGAAARAFEGLFVAEMLSQAGLGTNSGAFGGGEGEAAFSSFLTRAYADSIAASGRFGLSEAIARALSARAAAHV